MVVSRDTGGAGGVAVSAGRKELCAVRSVAVVLICISA